MDQVLIETRPSWWFPHPFVQNSQNSHIRHQRQSTKWDMGVRLRHRADGPPLLVRCTPLPCLPCLITMRSAPPTLPSAYPTVVLQPPSPIMRGLGGSIHSSSTPHNNIRYHTTPCNTTPYRTTQYDTAPYLMTPWWLHPFVLSATPPPPAAPHILHTVCHVIIFNAVIGKYLALFGYCLTHIHLVASASPLRHYL